MSRWVLEADLTNSTIWNLKANPTDIQLGYELSDYVRFDGLPQPGPGQEKPASVSVGAWLHYDYNCYLYNEYDNAAPINFTVLWVNGGYPEPYKDVSGEMHFIFTETPQVQALNCMPIFEKTNAQITVNVNDGTIEDYEFLDALRVASEAWDDNFGVHIANITAYNQTGGIKGFDNTVRYVLYSVSTSQLTKQRSAVGAISSNWHYWKLPTPRRTLCIPKL